MIPHTERFCSERLSMASSESIRGLGAWWRAPSRCMVGQEMSKWLYDKKDVEWGMNYGSANYSQSFPDEIPTEKGVNGK